MKLFISQINPSLGDTILDVGGYPSFWEALKIDGLRIICLNQDPTFKDSSLVYQKGISRVHGDGCNLSYGNQSFSVGFSNSVIEHVGDWAKQKAFALEILRVGRKIWVQTPAYECPIEPHFVTPFFQGGVRGGKPGIKSLIKGRGKLRNHHQINRIQDKATHGNYFF